MVDTRTTLLLSLASPLLRLEPPHPVQQSYTVIGKRFSRSRSLSDGVMNVLGISETESVWHNLHCPDPCHSESGLHIALCSLPRATFVVLRAVSA